MAPSDEKVVAMPPGFPFPRRSATPLAITHVTVIPMDSERTLPEHTVVIDGGTIRALGPSPSVTVQGIPTLDGRGEYLLPGLADMHVHYTGPSESVLFLAHGVTTIRSMGGAPFQLAFRRRVERGELPGPHIVCASPIVEGSPTPPSHVFHILDDPDQAAALVRRHVERGYQQLKVYNELRPAVFSGLGRACREAGLPMTGHCPNAMTFEEAMAAGMRCFEHLTGVWRGHFAAGSEPPMGLSNLDYRVLRAAAHLDYDAIRRLAARLAAADIWNCPTLVAMQHMYQSQAVGMADPEVAPWLRYLPARAREVWARIDDLWERRFAGRSPSRDEWVQAFGARDPVFARIVAILHEEHAPLLLGTDTAVRFVIPGLSLHQELANFVAAGLSPYEALRCGTVEAARYLGQGHTWGTVGVGKRADLILARANPLDDVRVLREPEAVLVNGVVLMRRDLEALLAQVERAAARRPPQTLPKAHLGQPSGDGRTVREGCWVERREGTEVGRVRYRHRRLPDGEWLVEEVYTFDQTGDVFTLAGGQRRSTRLRLRADGRLLSAEQIGESAAGTERCTVAWSAEQGYHVHARAVDGWEATWTIGGEPRIPDEPLGLTVLPFVLADAAAAGRDAVLALMGGDPDGATTRTGTVAAAEAAAQGTPGADRSWRLTLDSPGGQSTREYRFSGGGHFLGMSDGPRDLQVLDDAPDPDSGPM
jgi:imidazolonepropionase-like amidohydrolase